MRFQIEQIALCPKDPEAAIELLEALGAEFGARDHVVAAGEVFGDKGHNEADLAFDYQLGGNKIALQDGVAHFKLETEVLCYNSGPNWMDLRPDADPHRVSHLGMHVTEEELESYRKFFKERGIGVAQEVKTQGHTNPAIADSRRYHYTIFDTHAILGVDLKFIVRLNVDGTPYE